MKYQTLIHGSSQKDLEHKINLKCREGYRLVTGSTYICRHGQALNDDTIFTVHMRDNFRDYLILSNDLFDFVKQIENLLCSYAHVVIGSFNVKYFDYKDTKEQITTTLFCIMEK